MGSKELRFLILTTLIFAFALDRYAFAYGQRDLPTPEDANALTELDGHQGVVPR